MTPRRTLALAWLLCAACDAAVPAHDPAPTPPSLLLVLTDDMGLQLGAYGEPRASTPRMDELAREGLRFDRAFAAAPVCSPSRAALLTGLFPHANGHWGFPEDTRLRPGLRTLPDYLSEAGYFTGLVGKLHVAPHDAPPGARRATLERAPEQIPFDFFANSDGDRHDDPERFRRDLERFFAAADGRPFFLLAATHAPHNPYPGQRGRPAWPRPHDPARVRVPATGIDTPEFRELLARMYDALAEADALVGSLLDALEGAGRADDTLVILSSDQGPALPGAKTTLFDPGIRVPLLARWPGRIQPGGASETLVSGVDLLPTLLEAAGAARPEGLHGRSRLPLLLGSEAEPAPESAIFAEHTKSHGNRYFPQRAVRTARHKYVRNLRPDIEARNNSMGVWARAMMRRWESDPRARLLLERNVRHPREELFDLDLDPDELHNLAGDPASAETLARLRERLRSWMRDTDDPWLALWDHDGARPDPFEPRETRDGPFEPRWLDAALERVAGRAARR